MRELRIAIASLGLALSLAWASYLPAEEPPKDSLDRDYAAELPRLAPKEPGEALATFHVAPGFKLEQVAAEPLVTSPVAICFDENLRMFVCEMRGYSENKDDKVSRITCVEDTNGDGKFDKSIVFVEKLAWPTALFWWNGGLIVADAPDVFYFRDTDGDGKADERKVLYTGLGTSNVQGLVNSFQWGLENRIYVSLSSTGAELKQGNADQAQSMTFRGRDMAIEPHTWAVQPISGGAQHGMSMNDWGDRFLSSNSDHLQEVMYEDRYLGRNPYLAAPSPRKSIAADGPQADVFRTSPVEPWRIVRTRLRVQGIVPGPVEGGGRPAGYFTGATGATIYRGNAWPAEWRGLAVIGDVGSNLVHRKRLEPDGVGFIGRRIDAKSEFVSSSDNWFRPVQFANAPDGTLYILDMYREVIEHPASLPPLIKKHLDLTSGRDRGRIYRIVPDGFKQPALKPLGNLKPAELVALLESPNGWHRDTAARLLYEKQDKSAASELALLASKSTSPLARMHALHALAGINALTAEMLLPRLADEHPRVREHAALLAEKVLDSAAVRAKLAALAGDPELRVRYQVAFSLGELPTSVQRNQALAAIAKRDAADGYVRIAVLSSLGEGAGEVLSLLAANPEYGANKSAPELLGSLAAQIGKQQRAEDIAELLKTLAALAKENSPLLAVIVQKLAAKEGSPLAEQVAAATGGKAEAVMQTLLAQAAAAAGDDAAPLPKRIAAVEQLRLAKFADQRELFFNLLGPSIPADLQAAALRTMASYDTPEVAELALSRLSAFSPRLKGQATDVLLSRPTWTLALLSAIEAGQVSTGDLDPVRLKLLTEHRDEAIRTRASKLLAGSQTSKRADIVAAYKGVLEMKGDASRGKQAFAKTCAACHKVQGVGNEIGPNLAAMKARGPEAILLNVLDPNREVNPQYLSYALLTLDGRQLTGMIAAETATSVTLKRADNASDTVLRIDIDQLKSTGLSLMPEGLEKQVDQQTMADLLEYLRTTE